MEEQLQQNSQEYQKNNVGLVGGIVLLSIPIVIFAGILGTIITLEYVSSIADNRDSLK
jgi:hypothetical protein